MIDGNTHILKFELRRMFRGLTMEYDASSSDKVKELFATGLFKFKLVFMFVTYYNGVYEDSEYLMPLTTFFRDRISRSTFYVSNS